MHQNEKVRISTSFPFLAFKVAYTQACYKLAAKTPRLAVGSSQTYNKEQDAWIDTTDYFSYSFVKMEELPEQFILTRDEVNKLGIDSQTNVLPEHGLVYDGSQPPGTPF